MLARYHCLLFPRSLTLTKGHVNELRDILVHATGDAITSTTTTVPYSVEDLQKMLALLNHLTENVSSDHQGTTCVLSRFMFIFARQRFYDFHGQPGARLSREQSVHGKTKTKRSWLITLASPLLFYAPEVHLQALEQMWVDEKLSSLVWNRVMGKTYDEWQKFTLSGTVLLNANVAFLAIPGVDNPIAEIASYASVFSSIGCIILGLLLDRQNRTKERETAYEAARYMLLKSKKALGMETLATMHSLPYACLMWGMVTFLIAFLSMCFHQPNPWKLVLVGGVSFLIVAAIVWCIVMAWEPLGQTVEAHVQVEFDVAAEQREKVDECDDETDFRRLRKVSWRWPGFLFRHKTSDSDITVVDV